MKPFLTSAFLLLAAMTAHALPAEDHWTVELDPITAARFEEAAQLIEGEMYDDALTILEQLAIELPDNADVFNMLGFAYRKTGNFEKSAPAYERALYLKPTHVQALEYQGELFLMLGNVEGAEQNLLRIELHCAFPCTERDELAEAIDAWRAEHAQ